MVLSSLKQGTAHLHERVEAAVDIPRRVQSLDGYVELLVRLHGFYAPFEARLARVEALTTLGLDLARRCKAPLLRADLTHFGYAARDISQLPCFDTLPQPRAVDEALGCMYVVEGATLGGRIVCRHVERALGLTHDGCAFFSSYGREVGMMWKAFCAVAESSVVGLAAEQRALRFATMTFEAFEASVARPSTSPIPRSAT